MNLNSEHQVWSRWTFSVIPGRRIHSFAEVRLNCARFGRKAFGSATRMRIQYDPKAWIIDIQTEGHPVHDPHYVSYMLNNWTRFFVSGFGMGTEVSLLTKLEAGSRQDGKPSAQLILLPSISIGGCDGN